MSESTTNHAPKPFRVLGVDLAAQPSTTALCEITISDGMFDVTETIEVCDDSLLMERFGRPSVARIGIDSPFGWPIGFVNALSGHRRRNHWPDDDPDVYGGPKGSSTEEYRDLKFRATDLVVWEKAKKKPISVAVNSLGSVAMRNASLLSSAGAAGLSVDRSGRTGRFVEVYPAAALLQWGIDPKGKSSGGKEWCKRVVRQLLQKMADECRKDLLADESCRELLESQDPATICLANCDLKLKLQNPKKLCCSDHVVDAFVSAIVALMAELDRRIAPKREDRLTRPIPAGMEGLAKTEGWIALPRKDSLTRLASQLDNLLSEATH